MNSNRNRSGRKLKIKNIDGKDISVRDISIVYYNNDPHDISGKKNKSKYHFLYKNNTLCKSRIPLNKYPHIIDDSELTEDHFNNLCEKCNKQYWKRVIQA